MIKTETLTLFAKLLNKFKSVCAVGNQVAVLESLWFDLGEIESATNKFAKENMIGKGGFGEVYKVTSVP